MSRSGTLRGALALAMMMVVGASCGDDADSAIAADATSTNDVAGDAGSDTTTGIDCGDGALEAPEVCDDGLDNGAYGYCNSDCTGPGPACGDGTIDSPTEFCDDGVGLNGTYGHCDATCSGLMPFCGDDLVNDPSEACDDGEANGRYEACLADCSGPGPTCGDGAIDDPWEICDDGADNGTLGKCAAGCGSTPGCGDGVVVAPEVCDDGADNGTYGHCSADCSGLGSRCGDGVTDRPDEGCDHGADNGTYGHCKADCSALGPRCGDATLDDAERCDDGPLNGDQGQCRVDCSGRVLPWTAYPNAAAAAMRVTGNTCEQHDWLAKYMRYRLRLRGNGTAAYPGFVSVGTAAGESIPAGRREPHQYCPSYWAFDACTKPDLPDAHGLYKWGDATIWLGIYMEVLATEHAMFADLGLDTSQTASDLSLALKAFNRVDESAELPFNVAPARDGFFFRDDVPSGFTKRADGSYRFPRDDGAIIGYECVSSDISCDPPAIEDGSYVSQDQVIGLLHGLALIVKLLPADVIDDEGPLRDQAREMIHRMVFALREAGWKVTDPTGAHPPDAWGGNAIGFSNQLAKTANAWVGDVFGVADYRTLSSRVAGEAAWAGIQVIWDATHNYNRTMALRLSAMTSVWSADKIGRRAVNDNKDFYALTHAILNDTEVSDEVPYWRIESVLDAATCHGPCRGYDDCEDAKGYKAESRIMGPGDRSGSRHFAKAEFNGMDYMALHNAYYLVRRGAYGFTPPAVPDAVDCSNFVGLDDILANGPTHGQTYDPYNACTAPDLAQRFCGRSWGAWVDDAYRGTVTLFTRGGRWVCSDQQPCHIEVNGDDHTAADDLIIGGPGDDALKGGGGHDCIIGLGGDDVLEGGQGLDELHGGLGNDKIYGEGNNWIVLDGERDELYGGPGNDLLKGGPDGDALYGGPGDDELIGDSGDDVMEGEAGNDTLKGDAGEDVMDGGPGDDSLIGDSGPDTLWGGPGRDKLDGEGGDDYCDGGDGDDFVRGGDGDDTLIAGDSGQDRLCGNGGDDTLWGGWDGDQCRGGGFLGGTDTVSGCDDDTASQSECSNGGFNSW